MQRLEGDSSPAIIYNMVQQYKWVEKALFSQVKATTKLHANSSNSKTSLNHSHSFILISFGTSKLFLLYLLYPTSCKRACMHVYTYKKQTAFLLQHIDSSLILHFLAYIPCHEYEANKDWATILGHKKTCDLYANTKLTHLLTYFLIQVNLTYNDKAHIY